MDSGGPVGPPLRRARPSPVQYLKIDATFVRDLCTSPGDPRIQSIVAMAGQFGLRTVAEGVEDAETLGLVRDFGVDLAQGYCVGRPRPLRRFGPTHSESPPALL